ncbi:hypothetical protein [Streptomyces sp. SID161]|uniref:hypothetical protein n=1 Tax=Streptomyces sp. SID161 TaxID=2690251 RepID=UPI00136B94B7|nr:hypothetical protein [Streptomyces sp. SID161]MYW21961.1 hypothetical protein [Streptomyces sp. SID2955]MYW45325.1 hypothetical protein [Streptomyces sp. SID161]
MPGRTSAPYAPPTALPHTRVRPAGRASATRGVVAAVVATTALLLAANAGPARAAEAPPAPAATQPAEQ